MLRLSRCRRLLTAVCLCPLLLSAAPPFSQAKSRAGARTKTEQAGPADYRSRNFLVHTDLSAKEAKDLLNRLETMLKLISRYWGRRNPRVIECFVVKDLKNWPAAHLQAMDPNGLAKIRSGAGVTLSQVRSLGNRFTAIARVYAIAQRGVPQHEAVHAYCAHSFGRTGPVWYSEGMAEMGKCWKDKDSSVNCSVYIARYLRNSPPKDLREIVNPDQKTGDSWQNYAWRWALCHLLANNPNYASRFRPLGLGLLTKQPVSFAQIYGAMGREINFEYHFFISHLERGYRVDLCRWDWKAKYRGIRGSGALTSRIYAGKGWQPSRLRVKAGVEYEYSATGTWKTSKDGDPVTADGATDGSGKLQGVVFSSYKLSRPFTLGTYGTFKAPADGNLLIRCGDKWNELADNKGRMTIRVKVKGKGKPLSKPKNKSRNKSSKRSRTKKK